VDVCYPASFAFWIDLLSTLSLIPSISYLSSEWLIPSSYSSQLMAGASSASLLGAGRAVRVGTLGHTASQYLRVLRLIRICKLLHLSAQPSSRFLDGVQITAAGGKRRLTGVSSSGVANAAAASAPGSPSLSRPNTPPPPSPRHVLPVHGHSHSGAGMNGTTEMVGLVPGSSLTSAPPPPSTGVWNALAETPTMLRIHSNEEKRAGGHHNNHSAAAGVTTPASGSPDRNASHPPSPHHATTNSLSRQPSDARLTATPPSDKAEGRVTVVGNSIAMTLEMKVHPPHPHAFFVIFGF
jgi:hypothetical protein